MNRIALESGGWFDLDNSKEFEEKKFFDGKNMISEATGEQFKHETLYYTARCNWVMVAWDNHQGSVPRWIQVSTEHALSWLIKNGHELPQEMDATCANLEI